MEPTTTNSRIEVEALESYLLRRRQHAIEVSTHAIEVSTRIKDEFGLTPGVRINANILGWWQFKERSVLSMQISLTRAGTPDRHFWVSIVALQRYLETPPCVRDGFAEYVEACASDKFNDAAYIGYGYCEKCGGTARLDVLRLRVAWYGPGMGPAARLGRACQSTLDGVDGSNISTLICPACGQLHHSANDWETPVAVNATLTLNVVPIEQHGGRTAPSAVAQQKPTIKRGPGGWSTYED